jgi:hypothetical protein
MFLFFFVSNKAHLVSFSSQYDSFKENNHNELFITQTVGADEASGKQHCVQ